MPQCTQNTTIKKKSTIIYECEYVGEEGALDRIVMWNLE
jgi:hypothetical protein